MGDGRRGRMKPWQSEVNGRFENHWLKSEALRGNPLGDPTDRPVVVYLPPGYQEGERRYPSIYLIQGLTGQVDMWWNRAALRPSVPELVDRLFAQPDVPPAIVV